MTIQARIGEVIESSTTRFVAGAYQLLHAPGFGALVRAQSYAEDTAVYGLVYNISTGSREPGGRAVVRGRTYTGNELYDDQIYQAHPDLAEVLQTEFAAVTVGFVAQEQILHYLPPQPPPVHYSVYECAAEELVRFSASSDFFRTVLFNGQLPADELLAACLRRAAQARSTASRDYLVQAGRELARLLKDDYDRLSALLRSIHP